MAPGHASTFWLSRESRPAQQARAVCHVVHPDQWRMLMQPAHLGSMRHGQAVALLNKVSGKPHLQQLEPVGLQHTCQEATPLIQPFPGIPGKHILIANQRRESEVVVCICHGCRLCWHVIQRLHLVLIPQISAETQQKVSSTPKTPSFAWASERGLQISIHAKSQPICQ